jgi:4-hydroxy-tetrahydrodipicolinate reductase
MELVIVGYGRMGHEIEAAAIGRGHKVVARIDPSADDADFSSLAAAAEAKALSSPAVAIEFALPDGIESNLDHYGRAGVPVVIGTTGWNDRQAEVLEIAEGTGVPVVWGANFSVGANLFTRVVAFASRMAERAGGYDSAMVELHHRGKQDSPSGTALAIAREMLAGGDSKREIQVETLHRRIREEELHVASARVGAVPGTHTVYLDSPADTVELTHRARNRQGFAVGAVQAAEWLSTVSPGVYTVAQFFDDLFGMNTGG